MPGDYTRLRFNPLKDGSGILMQQGRVMLDQDWNELVTLLDRRTRAETVDILGRGTVPKSAPGFRIAITPTNDLTISQGRIYVDGMLAENHGTGATQYDGVLDELNGSQPVPFELQPYLPTPWTLPQPNPFVIPQPPDNGPHLVYLDVWEREETYLEDPDLVDKAVGVDTATRMQTVWQVKVLKDVGNILCSTPDNQVPGWSALTVRSAGQITTQAAGVAKSTDPCTIPPNGGYRGTENRTYRVEIHTPGGLGTAQFKWSRNNASNATPVTAVNTTGNTLTVVRTKRDSVLRFNPDNWVEVTDDIHEFAGLPGEMHQVQSVDDVNLTLTLKTPLTAGVFDASHPERHTRVTLWDQSGAVFDPNNNQIVDVDANGGLIPVQANTTVVLEDGIQVTFTLDPSPDANGQFNVGDYWMFTARVVDASIEVLTAAPPRGIHHHYCRLAVITFPNNVTNCPPLWPPDFGGGCDCGACVSANQHNQGSFTIQMAVDKVKAAGGGKVCLAPGIYLLQDTLKLSGAASVQIAGHGGTILLAPPVDPKNPRPAILIDSSLNVTLEDFVLGIAPGGGDPATGGGGQLNPGVMVQNSAFVTIERCGLLSVGNQIPGNPAIGLGGFVVQSTFRENVIQFFVVDAKGVSTVGPGTGVTHLPIANQGAGPSLLVTLDVSFLNNFVECGTDGINLDSLSYHIGQVIVADNVIGTFANSGITLAGMGVVAPVSHIDIHGNDLVGPGDGIVCGLGEVRICDNDIVSTVPAGQAGGSGIVMAPPLLPLLLDSIQIVGNRILACGNIGIEIRTLLGTASIERNVIENTGVGGIFTTGLGTALRLSVIGNQLHGVAPSVASPLLKNVGFAAGMFLWFVGYLEVEGNIVRSLGVDPSGNLARVGLLAFSCNTSRIAGNQVVNIGPANAAINPSAGIAVTGPPFDRTEVSGNLVRRSEAPPAQSQDPSLWRALYIGPVGSFATAVKVKFVQLSDNQVVAVTPLNAVVVNQGLQVASVRGNYLEAFGATTAVEVGVAGSCILSENQATVTGGDPAGGGGPPCVVLVAPSAAVSSNVLRGGSITLVISAAKQFTVVGNITSGRIEVDNQPLGQPWAQLNV